MVQETQRITAMFDDDIVRKLRNRQAKQIQESQKSISFSKVLNETLRKALKL